MIRRRFPEDGAAPLSLSADPFTRLFTTTAASWYIECDERCINEFLNYEKKPNGSFGAMEGTHDDLLMTRAIGLHICFYEMELPQVVTRNDNPNKFLSKIISAATI